MLCLDSRCPPDIMEPSERTARALLFFFPTFDLLLLYKINRTEKNIIALLWSGRKSSTPALKIPATRPCVKFDFDRPPLGAKREGRISCDVIVRLRLLLCSLHNG